MHDDELAAALDALEAHLYRPPPLAHEVAVVQQIQQRVDALGRRNVEIAQALAVEARRPLPQPLPPPRRPQAVDAEQTEDMRTLMAMHKDLIQTLRQQQKAYRTDAEEVARLEAEFIAPPTPIQFASAGIAATTAVRLARTQEASSMLVPDDDDAPIVYTGTWQPPRAAPLHSVAAAAHCILYLIRLRERARVTAMRAAEAAALAAGVPPPSSEVRPRRRFFFGRRSRSPPKLQKVANTAPVPAVKIRRAGAERLTLPTVDETAPPGSAVSLAESKSSTRRARSPLKSPFRRRGTSSSRVSNSPSKSPSK